MLNPVLYSTQDVLQGYWKLRVGDYRVVFKVEGAEVRNLGIGHRKHVYDAIAKRTAP